MHLLFISLLVASVGASLPSIFKDPASFVAGMVDANPQTIQKMEDMVNELIDAGQNEKNARIGEYDDSVAEFNSATTDHDNAKTALDIAAGKASVQRGIWEKKVKKEENAANVLLDRTNTLNDAQADFDHKNKFMIDENIRISHEREFLDKALPLLETLLPGVSLIEGKLQVVDYIIGRALLNTDLAAPDAIRKVVDKINALIGKGEQERAKANRDQANAEEALKKAKKGFNVATDLHTTAAGELGQAKNKLDSLTKTLNVKSHEYRSATDILAEKKSIMDSTEATMNEEVSRIDSEDRTLHQVLELLEGFLNEEPSEK